MSLYYYVAACAIFTFWYCFMYEACRCASYLPQHYTTTCRCCFCLLKPYVNAVFDLRAVAVVQNPNYLDFALVPVR